MTNQDNISALLATPEDNSEELFAVIELPTEDTDLVGGGPEVDNTGDH